MPTAGVYARAAWFLPIVLLILFGVAQKNVLNNLWAAPLLVLYRIITECFFGYEIRAAATIGRRFTIHHGYAVVINKNVVAGMISPFATASLSAIVVPITWHVHTLATASKPGANVIILGDITLGNNVTVGAGSVVLDSVPDNALVVGEKRE